MSDPRDPRDPELSAVRQLGDGCSILAWRCKQDGESKSCERARVELMSRMATLVDEFGLASLASAIRHERDTAFYPNAPSPLDPGP